jgi:hypothetical protein
MTPTLESHTRTGTLARGISAFIPSPSPLPLHNHHMPTLVLYLFRFRDPLTGKWVRARHKLQMPALQRQYAEWEITGAPEIRDVTPSPIEHFNPFRPPASRAYIAPMLL